MRAVTEPLDLFILVLMDLRLSKGAMFILDLVDDLDDDIVGRREVRGVMVFLGPRRPAMMYTVFLFMILKFITIA
jgi:hypothetical protein